MAEAKVRADNSQSLWQEQDLESFMDRIQAEARTHYRYLHIFIMDARAGDGLETGVLVADFWG